MRYDEDYVAGLKARISELEDKLSEREWVGLTKDEIMDIISEAFGSPYDVAVVVQAKLRGKNT